ncbi:hypothetical protein [Acinetobacter baumannii]|nr:hypothetical protein [Acinetobacter baumannii]
MFNEDEEKLAHENWYKNHDPIAYKFYRDLSPEFETDFYTSEIAWLARAKAQAVPMDFVIVPKELPSDIALKMANERILEQPPVKDPVLNEILEKAHEEILQYEQCRLISDYREMVKRANVSGAEG